MKKIISIMLIVFTALGLVACTDASQNKAEDESSIIEETNTIVSDEATVPEENDESEQETVPASSEKIKMIYPHKNSDFHEIMSFCGDILFLTPKQ